MSLDSGRVSTPYVFHPTRLGACLTARTVGAEGFEPPKAEPSGLQPEPVVHLGNTPIQPGLTPGAHGPTVPLGSPNGDASLLFVTFVRGSQRKRPPSLLDEAHSTRFDLS